MNPTPLLLSALLLLPIIGFVVGGYVGSKSGMMWRVRIFRDLDHLIGMVQQITAITHDRRIAPGVVVDALQMMKYDLDLPVRIEREWDDHPPEDTLDTQGQVK